MAAFAYAVRQRQKQGGDDDPHVDAEILTTELERHLWVAMSDARFLGLLSDAALQSNGPNGRL